MTPARVVVTGAGGGIGAALARRVAGDAGNEAAVNQLVDVAWDELGGVDLFCSNAGVLSAGAEDVPDEAWLRDWQVNVMSHVYVARALLPRWLDQDGGRLLITVSAAGLLTLLGSAPYAVTKHAALGFAEWLRVTYAHRGVVVQALCPQGVRTDMLMNGADSASNALLADGALEPADVAAVVSKALDGDSFLILPHPEVAEYYQRRATDTDRWLGGMNKIQRAFDRAAES